MTSDLLVQLFFYPNTVLVPQHCYDTMNKFLLGRTGLRNKIVNFLFIISDMHRNMQIHIFNMVFSLPFIS